MDREFWLERWEKAETHFHRDQVNPLLTRWATELFGDAGKVLVPLCGATLDLGWLAAGGWHAVGVELSPLACAQVVEREQLTLVGTANGFTRWEGEGITLLQGDIFELHPQMLGPLTGIWDRAALVALHPDQRDAYVALQRRLLGRGQVLLNTVAYDASRLDGPPWSVDEAEVRRLWPEAELLQADAIPALSPRFQTAGLTELTDATWRIRLDGSRAVTAGRAG